MCTINIRLFLESLCIIMLNFLNTICIAIHIGEEFRKVFEGVLKTL